MALTILNQPNQIFPIYTDYNWVFESNLKDLINFKYKINYDTFISGDTFTLTDTFERFPEPNGNSTFNLRKYISSKIESDYFINNLGAFNSIQPNPIESKFRLRVQEEYAYQFPWGDDTHTGVSENPTKFYNLYNLRLTNMDNTTPLFSVGSVVELIDNSNPLTNENSINGIYTVLGLGPGYIVVNGIFDPGKTYFSGSILWSDHRQVVNLGTTYTSTTYTSLNSCQKDTGKHIYTSLIDNSNIRINSSLMLPIIDGKSVEIWTVETSPTELFNENITTGTSGNGLLCYQILDTPMTIRITVKDAGEGILEEMDLHIVDKCNGRFTPVVLYFLDRNGSFIPFNFDLVNIKSIQTTNSNWKGLNQSGRSIKNQIDSQVTEQYQLTTDWLTDIESDLFEELFESNYIYMQDNSESGFSKVLIIDKQTQIKKTVNNKLFNYQINIELCNEKFINQ